AAGLLALAPAAWSAPDIATTATSVPGVQLQDLDPQHWIGRMQDPHRVILDRAGIEAQNARMRAQDPSIHDIAALPDPLPRRFVRRQVEARSVMPAHTLHGAG